PPGPRAAPRRPRPTAGRGRRGGGPGAVRPALGGAAPGRAGPRGRPAGRARRLRRRQGDAVDHLPPRRGQDAGRRAGPTRQGATGMGTSLTIECAVHFEPRRRGRKELAVGPEPAAAPPGRVPRVARLLALAHRLEGLLRGGVARDYAELGRLGHVTRARVSQLMSLLYLAPDLHE